MLANTFAANSSSANYDQTFLAYKSLTESREVFDTQNNNNPINNELTINDVINIIPKPVKGHLFADDISISCKGKNPISTAKLIQQTLDALQNWSQQSEFIFSKAKTEFIIYSRNKIKDKVKLWLNGEEINKVDTIKLLGLYIDKKLNWSTHVNHLMLECSKRINILKVFGHTRWGADKNSLLLTYKSLVRQKLDYGAIFYDMASSRLLRDLERSQNQALRISIGAYCTSPIDSILAESNEKYKDHIHFYTYGSVMNGKSGFAIISNFAKTGCRVHDSLSIFAFEAAAIMKTLLIISEDPELKKVAIFTDSLSCLTALANSDSSNPFILNLQDKINELTSCNRTIELVWIPSHQRIKGNEEADKLAKESLLNETIDNTVETTPTEFKKYIKKRRCITGGIPE
ncbi:uncharacterized protein LOC130670470 [Microplitis mediator]|uniref:uncharacterized protein LOC130670470 n=1 Tax=Microplitis mediator TaxID=375433 RepID=UPI002555E432|nr:uncharacterized protein LOC130670470 [Microplitis mediator]